MKKVILLIILTTLSIRCVHAQKWVQYDSLIVPPYSASALNSYLSKYSDTTVYVIKDPYAATTQLHLADTIVSSRKFLDTVPIAAKLENLAMKDTVVLYFMCYWKKPVTYDYILKDLKKIGYRPAPLSHLMGLALAYQDTLKDRYTSKTTISTLDSSNFFRDASTGYRTFAAIRFKSDPKNWDKNTDQYIGAYYQKERRLDFEEPWNTLWIVVEKL